MPFRDILLHLRFPFSVFLMPIFWLAVSLQGQPNWVANFVLFLILHVFIYPASNAYNSYFDKDEDSIGGLEHPPPVGKPLWQVANIFDAIGVILAFLLQPMVAVLVATYVLVSRAYSHPAIRLKKYAFISWLIVGLFQGAFVFYIVYTFGQYKVDNQMVANFPWQGMILSALILWAIYPITQVYQHAADRANGDITISIRLGIRGTFFMCIALFSSAALVAFYYLSPADFQRFMLFSLPVALYLGWWFWQVWHRPELANFKHTMRLNLLASVLLNTCFLLNAIL